MALIEHAVPGHARARLRAHPERLVERGARADPGAAALDRPPQRAAGHVQAARGARWRRDGVTLNTILPGRIGDRPAAGAARLDGGRRGGSPRQRPARAARHDRGDRRRRRLPLLRAGELHHRRGAAGGRRTCCAPPDARPPGRHPRLPVRPRRRADPDREGARRRLEADVRRVPALARTGTFREFDAATTTTTTWTASRARTACARSSQSRGIELPEGTPDDPGDPRPSRPGQPQERPRPRG